MPTDTRLSSLARREWLIDSPFHNVVAPYIEALRDQRYSDRTIGAYLGCLAHFSYWIKTEGIGISSVDAALIKRFLRHHLPVCACPAPSYCSVASSGAALRHLLDLLPGKQSASTAADPVAAELELFGGYLSNICGLAPVTRDRRVQHVGAFLVWVFGTRPPVISWTVASMSSG